VSSNDELQQYLIRAAIELAERQKSAQSKRLNPTRPRAFVREDKNELAVERVLDDAYDDIWQGVVLDFEKHY